MDAYDGNYLSAAQNLAGAIPGERVAAKAAGLVGKAEKAGKATNAAEKVEQEAEAASSLSCPITSEWAAAAHSFQPGTRVLMADGTSQAIETLQAGDRVQATDPTTGKTEPKPVTHTIRTPDDEHFTELTLQAAGSTSDSRKTENLTSTQHHPFWDETSQRWTNASELRSGDELRTADGRTLTVLTVRNYDTGPQVAYDLTIADLHTYYVLSGATPVLVHNDSTACKVGANGWLIPNMRNCKECAKIIRDKIGGVINHVKDSMGAPILGPSKHDPLGRWDEHFVVIKDGHAYDGFTGPRGMPVDQYRNQWKYGEYLKFTPWGGE